MVEKIYWAETKCKLFAPRSREKAVLVAIAHYANPDGYGSYASQERISSDLGCSRRTVRRHIKALVDRGELEVWVDVSRRVPTDHFFIPVVARTLEDLMKERQLQGLPLFQLDPRVNLSQGEGQTDPAPGTGRPSTKPLDHDLTKEEQNFSLKTKKEKSIEVGQYLDLLAQPAPQIAPETQEIIQETLKQLEAYASMGKEELVEPGANKWHFLPQLTEKTWAEAQKKSAEGAQ